MITTTVKEQIILNLANIGAIKFGTFTLKSGLPSPVYFDLRVIISHPKLLQEVGEALWELTPNKSVDLLCGVPYTALPIATAISLTHHVPMILRRKEKKEYGLKRMLEGHFSPGQNCLVTEDLVTSGGSVLETTALLEEAGLKVDHVTAILDRQQGGKQRLEKEGYHFHALFTVTELLDTLCEHKQIDANTRAMVLQFIGDNQT